MKKISMIISIIFCFAACSSSDDNSETPNPSVPVLQTTTISNITSNSANSGGIITSEGTSTILSQGVCWSTSSNPTLDNSHTTDVAGSSYTSTISSLSSNTTYHVRAYATNSSGTGYGNDLSFTTQTIAALTIPILTTSPIANITQQNASSGGNITSDGGAAIIERGICWNIVGNPTVSDSKATIVGSVGTFSANTTQLKAQTTYHLRAYAINSVGVAYGNEVIFNTLDLSIPGPNVTDVDGNIYHSVILGGVTWMVENLRTTKFQNLTTLTNITVNSDWQNNHPETGSYCYYNNQSTNASSYGVLYDFFAATNPQNIAPDGWKVPSKQDWDNLINYINFNCVERGEALKINTGSYTFQTPNNATNLSGFSAMPGGYRSGQNGSFSNQGTDGYWWTSTEVNTVYGKCKRLTWNSTEVTETVAGASPGKKTGLAIRCIKI